MTVKCKAKSATDIEKFLFPGRNRDTMDDAATAQTHNANGWSTGNGNVDIGAGLEPKNSSTRLSFSVDSLLSSIRKSKEPEVAENPDSGKPEMDEDDDDDDAELDVDDDSDDFVDDDDDNEVGSNPSNNPISPDLPPGKFCFKVIFYLT